MATEEENQSRDFFELVRNKSYAELNNQWERLKTQDWWTISKMLMAFSVLLIFTSGIVIILDIMISTGLSTLKPSNIPLLISGASLVVTLLSPTVLYTVLTVIIGAIAMGASVATGKSEVMYLESKRKRYLVHFGKLISSSIILIGYYQLIIKDMVTSILEFIFIMFGITGFLLLPIALLFWGVGGLWKEWQYE